MSDLGTISEQAGRAIVYARSQGRCELCQRPAHTVHHRVKRGQGGSWDPANLLHLCGDGTRFCHGWIEGHPAHALTLGMWLPAGSTPSHHSVWSNPTMWVRGWWWLNPEGMVKHDVDHPETRETALAQASFGLARLQD